MKDFITKSLITTLYQNQKMSVGVKLKIMMYACLPVHETFRLSIVKTYIFVSLETGLMRYFTSLDDNLHLY